MNTIDTLVKSIFQKESLQDCSLEELQTMARQYSYFKPVQFLLAEKLKSVNEDLYKEQLQKLSLHFTDPLWLDYLLNGYKTETVSGHEHENSIEDATSIEEKKDGVGGHPQQINTELQPEAEEEKSEEIIIESENTGSPTEISTAEENQANIEAQSEESFIKSESEISEPMEEGRSQPLNENSNVPELDTAEIPENAGTSIEQGNAEREFDNPGQVEQKMPEPENINSFSERNAVEEQQPDVEAHPEENIDSFAETNVLEKKQEHAEVPEFNTTSVSENRDSSEEMNETPISFPDLHHVKEEPTETELSFEPYHTVDYFASQGIKYVPEEKPSDRFGRQLKSFTEWLKTMKRLPQTEVIRISDSSAEEKVQQLADHSISEGEVVTETMAEVWLKQGNKEKAIEIYNKLGLLDPDKSAYFASLAEQLKNS